MNMKNKILAFLLAVVTIINIVPTYYIPIIAQDEAESVSQTSEIINETDEGYIMGEVKLSCDAAVGNRVTISKGDKEQATVILSEGISNYASYEWQMKAGDGIWAVISDYLLPYAVISESLIANSISVDGISYLRCVVIDNDKKYVTQELELVLAEEQKPIMMMTTPSSSLQESEPETISNDIFQIRINYKFRHATAPESTGIDGASVANNFAVALPEGGYYTGTVASPPEVGYLPYVNLKDKPYVTPGTSSDEVITYDGVQYVAANSLEFINQRENVEINVYYIPQEVEIFIKRYEQKLYSDEYTHVDTETYRRVADEEIGDLYYQEKHGFTVLPYNEHEIISEDGTYAIDIFYDRNYYLVNFDLAAPEANGATPHYVRYDTQITMPLPSRRGYSFVKWNLVSVTDGKEDEEKVDVPNHSYADEEKVGSLVTVNYNLSYIAEWELSTADYTIVYWLENAESTDSADKSNYDVWYTHKISSRTGYPTIVGADNIKSYIIDANGFSQTEINDVTSTYPYLTYQSALTDTAAKILKGDGTTTINIYYSRKQYTLKFYYAIEKTSNNKSTYHIIGGSTYYFGTLASGDAINDEVAAMRQYASGGYTSQTGQVTALPTLNQNGQQRNYTNSFDTDETNKYKYHYLSFKAKYGADISALWPCDVFNSAERTQANTHGNWSGKQAFVSAWNGEYRVRYTQDSSVNNGNQTIKGKYTQLDSNLLWNDTSITENTITYACFWENGANINWSVPELYRYNIYLPLLPNQSTEGLTLRTYNGTTYYLADQYDTCDDSNTSSQTRPGLVGFTANGRDWATIAQFDTSLYREAYDMFFYYSRIIYHITFNDQHGNAVTLTVPYGTEVGNHTEEEHTPVYPADFEEGESVFAGWYVDESCQIPFDHHITMPAKNIQLYAKWETLSYNVKIYYDKAKTIEAAPGQTVPFGTFLVAPKYRDWQPGNEVYKNQIFAGWYYMDGEEEKRFDFNTMFIKTDMVIYALWTSEVLVPYRIHYVCEKNGQYVKIADSSREDARALAGTTKTFIPKVGSELYSGYQTGYFPEMRSHSMTMSLTGPNEYYFIYSSSETVTYTVIHEFVSNDLTPIIGASRLVLDTLSYTISGEHVSSSAATVTVAFNDGITKDVVAAAAEKQTSTTLSADQKTDLWTVITQKIAPDVFEREIILTTNQTNVAKFTWGEGHLTGRYQVVQYYEDLTGEYVTDPQEPSIILVGDVGKEVTAYHAAKTGYDADEERLNEATGVITGLKVNPDGTISNGLVLRLYYSLKRYNYTIYHYENGTTNTLAASVSGSAPHGTVINIADVCVDVAGYAIYNASTAVELLEDNKEIKCYYKGLDVYYRYQIMGSSGGVLDNYTGDTIVGERPQSTTLTLSDGYLLNGWYYSIDAEEMKPLDPEWNWLSNNDMTISPTEAPIEWASKTVYIYAVVIPKTRRFEVTGVTTTVDPQPFMFTLKGKTGTKTERVNVTFAIIDNDYIDVTMLPYGEYTLTLLNFAWRFGAPTISFNGETFEETSGVYELSLTGEGTVVFNYSQSSVDNRWLSDDIVNTIHLPQSSTDD